MKPLIELDKSVDVLSNTMERVLHNSRECRQLVRHVKAFIASVEEKDHPQELLDQLQRLSETLVDLNEILVDINEHPQLKNILWRVDISTFVSTAYKEFPRVNFYQFEAENETARRLDTDNFYRLIRGAQDDNAVLAILGVPRVQFPQAELAIRQRIEKLEDNGILERRFLEHCLRAMAATQYRSPTHPEGFMISLFDVIIHRGRTLGEGSCGKVFKGRRHSARVAIKVLKVPQALVENEINILKQLRHENVLQMFGACRNPGEPFLVCAFKPGGDVINFLDLNPEADRRKLSHEASLGLAYLHENLVIHGDLKPLNVLVDERGVACLCDFGLSRIRTGQTVLPMVPLNEEPPITGTLQYMSPEQMRHGITNEKSDVYSFGMTIYEIFSGDAPFENIGSWSKLRNGVECGSRPPKPAEERIIGRGFNDALWNLIEDCWTQDPAKRPTAVTIVSRLGSLSYNVETEKITYIVPKPSSPSSTCRHETPTCNCHRTLVGVPLGRATLPQIVPRRDPRTVAQESLPSPHPTSGMSPLNCTGESEIPPNLCLGDNKRLITCDDIIIAILGPTGTGKSSFVNMATGQPSVTVGHDLDSCTQNVQAISCSHPDGSGRTIVFVDTPGFEDTKRTDYDILRAIADWLNATYKQKITLTGILFFHRISESRMRGTPLTNLEIFKELCGPNALQNVILTTTMWDQITKERGLQHEKQLTKKFWQPMMDSGCRIARFESTHESAWGIINMFDFSTRRPVKLQEEMVDQGKKLRQTGAYAVFLRLWANLKGSFRKPKQFRRK